MLPRENRIVKKEDFEKIKREGSSVKNPFFLTLFLQRGDGKPSRFGFIVSSKISKRAVDRNRVKRLLRIAIGNLISDIREDYDIIFIARKNVLLLDKEIFFSKVAESLRKKNILK
ncbi:MAG: hypothetical protein KatS3mg088_135 [Patescibacteria group bacterium]|nr:MAG: hypothetical protein KatS3mg088_135 [Patescibacteria group bacterium]